MQIRFTFSILGILQFHSNFVGVGAIQQSLALQVHGLHFAGSQNVALTAEDLGFTSINDTALVGVNVANTETDGYGAFCVQSSGTDSNGNGVTDTVNTLDGQGLAFHLLLAFLMKAAALRPAAAASSETKSTRS